MTITINNKVYNFRVTGTVGLVYLAERALGCAFEPQNTYHNLVLYYCCLAASNRDKDIPEMTEFIASLTTSMLTTISTYFWAEWRQLEGEPKAEEDIAQGEG